MTESQRYLLTPLERRLEEFVPGLVSGLLLEEAYRLILDKLEKQQNELVLLRQLKEELTSYSVGISFMSEEKPRMIIEALNQLEECCNGCR